MLDWPEIETILARHDIELERPVASAYEGLVIGNADMGATIYGPPENLTLRLGKMDLWDARWNAEHYTHPLPLSQLKTFVCERSRGLAPQQPIPMELNDSWQGHERLYPCMRMGADVVVRVAQNVAGYPAGLRQRLCLANGSYLAEFELGWWRPFPRITCRAFVSWQRNVLVLRFDLERPSLGRNLVVGLWRDPLGGRSWGLLSALGSLGGDDQQRDPRVDALPPAEMEREGALATLWQAIPGDADAPERGFALAAHCGEGAEFLAEPSGQAVVEARGLQQLTLYVGMASEFEAPGSRERARQLAQEAAQVGYDALYAEHAAAWKDFWRKSAIELGDDDLSRALERQWVRSLYALGMNSRAGRPATPLFGVSTIMDCPPWRGDRHNNWPEYSNRFWGAYGSNHEEQALNYCEFVHSYLPVAERIAREVFEVEEGAVYPHCYIDGTRQYYFHFVWGYNLYVTAAHAQNCWWHYEYFRNRDVLERLGYPVLRACADFYVQLVAKNEPGDYSLWPTIAAEIRGWTRNFELNKNCVEDLAYVKFLLRGAITASEELGVDAGRRESWRDLLEHLPAYPTLMVDGEEEFVDFAGQTSRPQYNCSVPLAPMWPTEDVDVFSSPHLRAIANNTAQAGVWLDPPREALSLIRLGLDDLFWQRLPTYLALISPWHGLNLAHHGVWSVLVNELLLSSWDGVIHVFPCWPLERTARFRNLRAKGAFLVSASCGEGQVQTLAIHSEKGGRVQMQAPWPNVRVSDREGGAVLACIRQENLLSWDTLPGHDYDVTPTL